MAYVVEIDDVYADERLLKRSGRLLLGYVLLEADKRLLTISRKPL